MKFLGRKLIFCYADDTLVLLTAENKEELIAKIRKVIQDLEMEMSKRGLILNRKKTAIMLISKLRKYVGINRQFMDLEGVTLQFSNPFKYLGISLNAVSYTHLTLPTIYSV